MEKPKWTDVAIVVLTVGIVCLAGMQWWEMHSGGAQTDRIISAAQGIEYNARQIVADNREVLAKNKEAIEDTLRENREELAKALAQNRHALDASASQGKMALQAAISASRLDQRSWVVVSKFALSEEPQPDKDFSGIFWMVNSGTTPALNVSPASRLGLWGGQPPPADFANSLGTRNRGMIPPRTTGDTHFYTGPLRLTKAQVDAYAAGAARIYADALIAYDDAFGTGGPHWTKVCVWHASGRPLDEFGLCDQGNDVDHQ